jgi:hypothetical protein
MCGYWVEFSYMARGTLLLPNGRVGFYNYHQGHDPIFWQLSVPEKSTLSSIEVVKKKKQKIVVDDDVELPEEIEIDFLGEPMGDGDLLEEVGSEEEEAAGENARAQPTRRPPHGKKKFDPIRFSALTGFMQEKPNANAKDAELVVEIMTFQPPDANHAHPRIKVDYEQLLRKPNFLPMATIIKHYKSVEAFLPVLNDNAQREAIPKTYFTTFADFLMQNQPQTQHSTIDSASSTTTACSTATGKPITLPPDAWCKILRETNSWKTFLSLGACSRALYDCATQYDVRLVVWLRATSRVRSRFGALFGELFENVARVHVITAYMRTNDVAIVMRNLFMKLTFEIEPFFGRQEAHSNYRRWYGGRGRWHDFEGGNSGTFTSRLKYLFPFMAQVNPYAREFNGMYFYSFYSFSSFSSFYFYFYFY